MRLGCHDLNCSAARSQNDRRGDSEKCVLCDAGVKECIQHVLCECPTYDVIRKCFYELAESACPGFKMLSDEAKITCLLKDDTP